MPDIFGFISLEKFSGLNGTFIILIEIKMQNKPVFSGAQRTFIFQYYSGGRNNNRFLPKMVQNLLTQQTAGVIF
jgi:hypothetical protein